MLILELCKLPDCEYTPRLERPETACPKKSEEAIWDRLGYYEPKKGEIIICDKDIQNFVGGLHKKEMESNKLILFVRELVRLHEHAHAFLHTAKIKGGSQGKGWYCSLPEEINEPITEFIVRCIIEDKKPFVSIFNTLDKNTLPHYRKWKDIAELFNFKCTRVLLTPVVKFARSETWNNWEQFYSELKGNKKSINSEAVANKLRG